MSWQTKKLGDACIVEYGERVVRKRDGGSQYPVYGGGGATFFMDRFNREDAIVISRFGLSEKCVRFVRGKFFLNDSGLSIKPRNFEELNFKLLQYLALALEPTIYELSRGTAQRNLNVKQFRELLIRYPESIEEQKRIVAMLDEAFAALDKAKENTEKNVENARELFFSSREKAIIDDTSQNKAQALGDLLSIKHGFAFKSQFFKKEGKHVLLTPGNFYEEGGYRDRGEKQKYYGGDVPEGYLLSKGDLLIAMTEQAAGLLGSPLIVPESGKFLHNQRLGLVQLAEESETNKDYLYHLFNTKYIREQIHKTGSGVKVRHTSPKKVQQVNVTLPSEKKQEEISNKLSVLDTETKKLRSHYERKTTMLEETKSSILHKAFEVTA